MLTTQDIENVKFLPWKNAVSLVKAHTSLDDKKASGFVCDCKQGLMTDKRIELLNCRKINN